MNFSEFEKNELISLMKEFSKVKEPSLYPVIEEVIQSLELGSIIDAYQARYIRDAIHLSEETKIKFQEMDEKLEKAYFS